MVILGIIGALKEEGTETAGAGFGTDLLIWPELGEGRRSQACKLLLISPAEGGRVDGGIEWQDIEARCVVCAAGKA